jgi:signal transduction histidine kinase
MVSISASKKHRLAQTQPEIVVADPWQKVSQDLFHLLAANTEPEPLLVDMASALSCAFAGDGHVMILPRYGQSFAAAGFRHNAMFPRPLAGQSAYDWTELNQAGSAIVPTALNNLEFDASGTPVEALLGAWNQIAPECGDSARAILGLPIQFQGEIHGLLGVVKAQPYAWTDQDIAGLTAGALPIAIALSQFHAKHRWQQQDRYQAIVNQLTFALRHASDLNEIIRLATEGTAQALHVPRGMLLRLKYWDPLFKQRQSEETPKVRVSLDCEWYYDSSTAGAEQSHASPAASSETLLNQSFWISECALCDRAFNHPARALVISDQRTSPDNVAAIFNTENFPALIMAPLESQGMVLGFLVFQQVRPEAWSPEDIELVELVAAQVSAAIIQAETLRQVQSLVEKRTAELRHSLAVQAKLYDRTRQQIDQLRRLNQMKDEFLSTVSHELRTPLTSMTMAIRMLRQTSLVSESLSVAERDRAVRYIDILEQQCSQEVNLVNDLLTLQELESKKARPTAQDIDVVALVKDLAIAFDQKWAPKGLILDLALPAKSLRMQTDLDSVRRILLELLTNAGKYAAPQSAIQLNVVHNAALPTGQVILSVRNVGPGISPADLPHIFDKFRRSSEANQNAVQGTGLGLALVQSLVQHLNGAIAVTSDPIADTDAAETCFTLMLPQVLDA